MTNAQDTSINPEDDLFYFETDHLALRGNKDYSDVLKSLLILCAQRKQAIKDYNKAVELKKEALADPSKVLEKIINGESLGMPDMHHIAELPAIDWSKYDIKLSEEDFKLIYSESNEASKKKHSPKKEPIISQGKWTTEEQKRLEELLQQYPPEPVEMRRYKKIAEALGNRTTLQVCSRVQKYLLKLYKAGLPIPGRIPKYAEKYKKSALHKHQRHNHYLWKPTTFFPDLCVPVVINELENIPGPSTKAPEEVLQSSSSNYLISTGYHEESDILPQKSQTELQLELLKRIRKVKIKDDEMTDSYSHIGFKCDYCGEEPISGTRWHCNTCTTESIDFCTDCVLNQMYSDNCHPLNHALVTCSDKQTVYFSDSESNAGSGIASCSKNNDSSDSSDSDFNTEDVNEDEMSESFESTKDQVMSNGIVENNESKISDENFSHLPKLEFGSFNESEMYDTALGSDLFSEIDNISYNYLHSNLLLDKD